MPDPVMVQESLEICQGLVTDYRDDLVAQNAFGYCLLEQRKGNEAEHVFLDVLARDKHFLAARHGRALACLIQKKQIGRALDYFQDTVQSQNPQVQDQIFDLQKDLQEIDLLQEL